MALSTRENTSKEGRREKGSIYGAMRVLTKVNGRIMGLTDT